MTKLFEFLNDALERLFSLVVSNGRKAPNQESKRVDTTMNQIDQGISQLEEAIKNLK